MADKPASGRSFGGQNRQGMAVTEDAVSVWFIREILPLEAILMTYLRHNWRNTSELVDLRQEVYARVFEAALERVPDNPKRFLFACARNLLINLARHEQVVPIEAMAEPDALEIATDAPGPERTVMARDELRRLEAVLDRLPRRAREAVCLAYFEGLTGKEIAERMGVTPSAASQHLANGVLILSDVLYGAPIERGRKI